jgi:heptosyltransferase III
MHRSHSASRVALVLSPALGDSLLMMIVAHNLHANRIAVTVFGKQASEMAAWFPEMDIRPDLDIETLAATLADFDTVIQMHRDRPFANLDRYHRNVALLDSTYRVRSSKSMAERLSQFCRDELGLPSVEKSNGIAPPGALHHRKYPLRVAIHPTASTPDKCWLPSRFIRLALKLRDLGFDPQFVVAPHERNDWLHVEQFGIALPELGTLNNVAAWLFESGWFIGNDSGIGHLASNLQVPTLSLFMRRGIARTWQPGWGTGRVVFGSTYLPTGRMRERYWKYTLSVARVARAFEQLRESFA